MGSVSLSIFTFSSEPSIYIPTHNKVEPFGELIPTVLEYIQLLLDQQSEVQFQWTPYEDPKIWAVILEDFFQNLNIWHVKVPLVNYAAVEMQQTDRVLRKFKFRQPILVEPEVLDEQHKIYLWLTNTNLPLFWSEYIEIWENWYDYIPDREPIIIPELACTPNYMPWFRMIRAHPGHPPNFQVDEARLQILIFIALNKSSL